MNNISNSQQDKIFNALPVRTLGIGALAFIDKLCLVNKNHDINKYYAIC